MELSSLVHPHGGTVLRTSLADLVKTKPLQNSYELKIRRVQFKVFPSVPIGSTARGIACDECECLIGVNARRLMFFLSSDLLLTSPGKGMTILPVPLCSFPAWAG